jgi:hypothetical protein
LSSKCNFGLCWYKLLHFQTIATSVKQHLLDATKEAGLEVSLEKTKHMLISRHQKAGQRYSIKKANRSFEDEAKFKYLGTTLTDQNCVHEEIKSSLNSKNACYDWVQSLVFLPAI